MKAPPINVPTEVVNTRAPWGQEYRFVIGTEREGDHDVIGEVVTGDTYKLENTFGDPEIILDIGAHIGTFTVMVAEKYPRSKIIAVEPNKRNFQLLDINTAKYDNVHIVNAAVSYKSGSLLVDGKGATGGGFVTSPEAYEDDARRKHDTDGFIYSMLGPCHTVTIQDLATFIGFDRVDIAKWDCEGGEVDAFLNMSDETAAMFDDALIVGEYHIDGGYRAFEKIANDRFPQHSIIGRPDQVDDASVRIGWFQMTPPNGEYK